MGDGEASVISSLPEDILSIIFGKCKPKPSFRTRDLPRILLSFSQVCRRWREVALNDPRLWTAIIFTSSSLARMMLERAQDAPLRIHAALDSADSFQNPFIEDAIARHATVGTLYLSNVPQALKAQVARITGPMPILTELELIVSDRAEYSVVLQSDGLEQFEAP